MDRTFAPNYAVVGGKRTYQNRDKANGVPGTSLDAEDQIKIEEELIGGIIEKAGLTPDRTDLSQVNKALSIMYAAYERSIAPYSADVAKRIGGYPLNAVVCDVKEQGVYWRSVVAANMTVPGADGANWVLFFDGYATMDWVSGSFQTSINAVTTPTQTSGTDGNLKITTLAYSNVVNGVYAGGYSPSGEIKSYVLAGVDRANEFSQNQTFNATVTLADGRVLQTIGGAGGVIVNRYTDGNGLATTDLNNAATGANISWFRLFQDGMLRTNRGDVTFTSDFNFNKNTNGYIILPSGLIIQWGKVNPSGGTYNFPITFPNAVFNIVSGNSDYQGQYADTAYAWSVSTSQFRAGTKAVNTGWATSFEVSWVAFGF